ncbi:MAG TPA: hypothetical protein VIW68_12530 [Candidatus Sulfotelmatobacter sp.]
MSRIGKASAIALTLLSMTGVSLAQKYKYTPPAPHYSAPAPHYSAPKAAPQRSAPQRSAPRQSAPRQSAPRQSAPRQSSRTNSQPRTSSRSRTSSQARQQRTQAKQQQQQQKLQAKQQREQAKQQARQQKAQAKQQQQQQKLQAKQQREQAKQQKNSAKAGNQTASASHPAAPVVAPPAAAGASASAAYHVPANENVSTNGPTALSKGGSQSVVSQLNSSRGQMSGVNARPLPSGDVTVHPNGHLTLATAGGQQYGLRPNGSISSFRDGQNSASFNKRGMVSSVHTANLSVTRSFNGSRTIVSAGPEGRRLVSTGPHAGYVENNVVVGGRRYIERTTIINRQIVTTRYVGYSYGGVMLSGYVAPFYYSPGFYGYAFNPWADPLEYDFGWDGMAWYGGPNPYFGAYAVYPSAAYWLTDYLVGQTLSAAFQMHEEAVANRDADYAMDASASETGDGDAESLHADANTPITPELKGMIADEVKDQIESDKEAAAAQAEQVKHDELIGALNQPNHVFMASSDLDVITDKGQNCTLQAGDVLKVIAPPGAGETIVQLRVAANKRGDCPAGVAVGVALQDLQEMQNTFHAQVESGLGTLMAHQGDGIPAAPLDSVAHKPQPTIDASASVSEAELTAMLDNQRQQADQAEAQVTASVK